MKVSHDYPVLQQTEALIIVCGSQSAKIYRIHNGELVERDTIHIDNPEYTDREGRFEYRGPRGRLHGSGSVYEPKNEYVHKKFLTELVAQINGVQRPYDSIYVLAPQRHLHEIEQALPKRAVSKLVRAIAGNFTNVHPTEILNRIKKSRKSHARVVAASRVKSSEAAKILRRGRSMVRELGRPAVIK